MQQKPIYILGGYQSDFARNWRREGATLFDLFADTVQHGLAATRLDPGQLEVGHVGNFVAPLYTGQAHLGGFFSHVDPALANMPASSHEAACASGSMAILGAMAELEAGRYDLAGVVGIEIMRNSGAAHNAAGPGGDNLRAAAWVDKEWQDAPFVWPCAFDQLIDEYERRFGIDKAHLTAISQKNFSNAMRNPNAQTRSWSLTADSFTDDDASNPIVSGRIRKQDCGQAADGAAVVFLATESKAREYAQQRGLKLDHIPRIKGWGHCNAPMLLQEKLRLSAGQPYMLPHVSQLFRQTLGRAGFESINCIDGLEVHDCFNITEYMIIDHSGLYPPGEAWKAIDEEVVGAAGRLPVNCSGGLIGSGHPVGATGVRMALDCYKQTAGKADGIQIEGAQNMMTINLGGSATTCASFIIGT